MWKCLVVPPLKIAIEIDEYIKKLTTLTWNIERGIVVQ
jgi:hypothetical protein